MIEWPKDECGCEPEDLGTLHMVTKAKYNKVVAELAESHHALGEIVGLLQHQLDNEDPDDLVTILQLLDALMIIARKHWKGGK